MKRFRFIQISDVHVDSKLSHSQIGLPEEKRQARIREINALVSKMCQLAKEANVEAVLIPGDLWDDESVSAESVNQLVECFAKIEPIPVFITPGNHDFYSLSSLYNCQAQKARAMTPWPNNVYIFRSSDFTTFPHPTRRDVSVTGRAFRENVAIQHRLLRTTIVRPAAEISVLLFHGSLDDYLREGKDKITAPFSRDELIAQNFSYAAIGHYHHCIEIRDSNDRVKAAYSGSTAGRTLTETGPRYVLIGEVDAYGLTGEFQKVQLDDRVIHDVEVDLTDARSEQALQRVESALRSDRCKASDIVCLRLKGRIPYGFQVGLIDSTFRDRFFHLKLFNCTRPDYDLDRYDERTTEGRFIREMRRLIESAPDPEARQRAEQALYYGLDALIQKEVKPRYED